MYTPMTGGGGMGLIPTRPPGLRMFDIISRFGKMRPLYIHICFPSVEWCYRCVCVCVCVVNVRVCLLCVWAHSFLLWILFRLRGRK